MLTDQRPGALELSTGESRRPEARSRLPQPVPVAPAVRERHSRRAVGSTANSPGRHRTHSPRTFVSPSPCSASTTTSAIPSLCMSFHRPAFIVSTWTASARNPVSCQPTNHVRPLSISTNMPSLIEPIATRCANQFRACGRAGRGSEDDAGSGAWEVQKAAREQMPDLANNSPRASSKITATGDHRVPDRDRSHAWQSRRPKLTHAVGTVNHSDSRGSPPPSASTQ